MRAFSANDRLAGLDNIEHWQSPITDNPADDHTTGPFDPALGRNTDRLLLRLVRQ